MVDFSVFGGVPPVADPQSLLEEKEALEEKLAISGYELRLAQEDILKLKTELEKKADFLPNSSKSNSDVSVDHGQDIQRQKRDASYSDLGPLKDNERRDLNCAVKEYLLLAGYRLTAMTFYEESWKGLSGVCVKGKQSFSTTAEWNPLSEGWVKLKINGCFLGNLDGIFEEKVDFRTEWKLVFPWFHVGDGVETGFEVHSCYLQIRLLFHDADGDEFCALARFPKEKVYALYSCEGWGLVRNGWRAKFVAGLGPLIVVCTQDNLSAFLCEGCSGLLVWQFCRQKYRKVWNLALLSKSWCMWEKHNRKLFGERLLFYGLHMKWGDYVIDQNLDVWQNTPACVPDALRHYYYQYLSSTAEAAELSLFRMPRVVARRLEKLQRDFLWGGGSTERKAHLVNWERVCVDLPVPRRRCGNASLWQNMGKRNLGGGLKRKRHQNQVLEDPWCGDVELARRFPQLFNVAAQRSATVGDIWDQNSGQGSWNLRFIRGFNDWELNMVDELFQILRSQRITLEEDLALWKGGKNGKFDVKEAYGLLISHSTPLFPKKGIWVENIPSKLAFFAWEATWERVLTLDRLQKRVASVLCGIVLSLFGASGSFQKL
ncbi:hypothetical protein CK203_053447 [Vitis vinifera]|uniref:Reverse transcriptase zinc-binding domain-containing protein n=1 Tax=Vitis vinifera TaxID=29760 RepID=A0A438GZ31_VITVI|nr:hypothetical protein CK203_053447 [Vitis vinifera]